MKKTYEQPVLVAYGSVEELTQANLVGTSLDSAIPGQGITSGHLS